jgi:hypothetical protein
VKLDFSLLSNQGNTNAALLKKLIDIASDIIVFGNKIHLIKSQIPLLNLIIGLIGICLQSVEVLLEKNKPWQFKLASLIVLGLAGMAIISIFALAVTFPLLTMALSISVLLSGIILEVANLALSIHKTLKIRHQINQLHELSPQIKFNTLERLGKKRQKTLRALSELIGDTNKNHETYEKQKSKLLDKIILIDSKIKVLSKPELFLQQKLEKQYKDLRLSILANIITIGSALTTIVGLALTPINPLAGLIIIAISCCFDIASLSRHIYNKRQQLKSDNIQTQLVNEKKLRIIEECENVITNDYVSITKALGGVEKIDGNTPKNNATTNIEPNTPSKNHDQTASHNVNDLSKETTCLSPQNSEPLGLVHG